MLQLLRGQRNTSDPEVMMRSAAEAVGRFLQVDRVGFLEVEEEALHFTFGWASGRLPLLTGTLPATGIGIRYLAEVRAGRTLGISNVTTDPLTAGSIFPEIGTVALIGVPIIRNGRWSAGFYVNYAQFRVWTAEEIALVQDVGEQTWDAVERARAQTALRKSEERLTFALEAGGGLGTWDWDVPADRVYSNPRFAQMFSISAECAASGVPVSSFVDIIHPDDRQRVADRLREAIESGGDFAEEYRVLQAHGPVRWVYARGRCHLNEAHSPIRFPGVAFDITERKSAEAALRQQWHTFDTALSHSPYLLFTFDLEGRFTYANRALLTLWQMKLQDVIGKNTFDLGYPSALAERLQGQVQHVIETREAVHDETPFTGPDGETRHYEYIFAPVFSEDKQVEAVIGSSRDITERLQAEEALRESEGRFRFLAESIPQMVWTATPDGALNYVNSKTIDYFGVPSAEILGDGWLSRIHLDDRPQTVERWSESLANSQPYETAFRLRRGSDASWRWHLVRGLPLVGDNGKVLQWFGTCTDIEQQKATEAELTRANRELEEFAYVASHDLQEPLRMVNIYTQMILKNVGGQDPNLWIYEGFVRQGVGRMESLIHDLLTFSRAVHADRATTTADLGESLAEAMSVLKSRIEENGAVIVAQALPTIPGETSQYAHVFQNLLSNALKYRNKDLPPEIIITAERQAEEWRISVRDNGIGFEQQYAKRIFGLFKRLYKDEYPGTGLGLAICQRIIERCGGRMWAEGRPGEGATFYFSLPAG